ncbi:MAG: nitrous oxide reductase family maturation protein NosD [Candidatus Krumholzibacteria bacterium]|nr:nitrous oxide reductase family maturation protein NosD [Candidatus Krumholzibacteria bacterium]
MVKPSVTIIIACLVTYASGAADSLGSTRIVGSDAGPKGLFDTLVDAVDGDTVLVTGGRFDGHIVIDRSITLIGQDWPVIDGGGTGTVVTVSAPDVTIRGCVIRNSGVLLEAENAGLAVGADRVAVVGNRIEDVLFGVYLRQADSCLVRANRIAGYATLAPARRGDLVRAWYSKHASIEDNVLEEGRDLIVWFSDYSVVRGNTVSNARYGVHLMYDSDCEVSDNVFIHNSVGAYLMYSRRLVVQGNTMAYNRGPSGFGLGLKDLDDTDVTDNFIVDNRVGIFVDNSPREIDSSMLYKHNVIAYNDQGVRLHASVERTRVTINSFMDNYEHVSVPGGGHAPRVEWYGNYWSDYEGYDADGDGTGDVPYRSEKLFEDLIGRHPKLRLFVYSPAIQAMSLAARAFPVVRPQPKLIDNTPRLMPYFTSRSRVIDKRSALPLGAACVTFIGLGIVMGLKTGLGGNVKGPRERRRGGAG